MEGNIVVDGVLASCYPSAFHDLAHIAMTPAQWFPNVMEWVFGESNGFSVFVAIIEHVAKWVLPEEVVSFGFK